MVRRLKVPHEREPAAVGGSWVSLHEAALGLIQENSVGIRGHGKVAGMVRGTKRAIALLVLFLVLLALSFWMN